MSLVEQRAAYMSKLQSLIESRQKDIDDKVAAKRLELENDVIVPYRAQLEQTQATQEMTILVDFINDIDKMLAYENGHEVKVEETVEEPVVETLQKPVTEPVSVEEVEQTDATFCDTDNDINDAAQETPVATPVEEPVGTSFDTLVSDIADTKAQLKSADQSRPGMSGIILPRR